MLKSLDPRVNRLHIETVPEAYTSGIQPDQFQTFQVFVQVKEGKSYEQCR